jgi:hypothetical protein
MHRPWALVALFIGLVVFLVFFSTAEAVGY